MARSFHANHSENIRLLDNGAVAHRFKGYSKGIVFTKERISIGEMFEIKIIEEMEGAGQDDPKLVSY